MSLETPSIIAQDNYVFVLSNQSGLSVFKSVSITLLQPTLNVNLVNHLGGQTNAVSVQGAYAYVGTGSAMTILDIADPTRPRQMG